MDDDGMQKWAGISAGAGFTGCFIWSLYDQILDNAFNLIELIIVSLGFAFLAGVIGAILYGVYAITANAFLKAKNPFIAGATVIVMPLLILTVADAMLLRGTYLFFPIISLVFHGTLDETFYSCQNWITADQGSYCGE